MTTETEMQDIFNDFQFSLPCHRFTVDVWKAADFHDLWIKPLHTVVNDVDGKRTRSIQNSHLKILPI